jgi:hypothetical protein
VWRRRHGNTRHSREITSGTLVATIARVVYLFAAALSFAIVYGVAIALSYDTRGWWIPGTVLAVLGASFGVFAVTVTHGRGLDGLGLFFAGFILGGLAIVFGCVGLVIAAILHSRSRTNVAPRRPIAW